MVVRLSPDAPDALCQAIWQLQAQLSICSTELSAGLDTMDKCYKGNFQILKKWC